MSRTYILLVMLLMVCHSVFGRTLRKRQDLFDQRVEMEEYVDKRTVQYRGRELNEEDDWYDCRPEYMKS